MANGKSQKILFLEKSLRMMALLVLKKYEPNVIGITGSVGKTSAKEAIFSVLAGKFRVRRNEKNYNNEIGLPLTIIGSASGGSSILGWLKVFLKWLWVMLWPVEYPEILVLEMGADRPGDIKYLTDFIRPSVGVVTDVSFSHIEFFKTVEEIAKEKGTLVRNLGEKGLAVLNVDNEHLLEIKEHLKSEVITYGFGDKADIHATDIAFSFSDDGKQEIKGLSFKLNYKGTTMPVRLHYILARHQVYAALAAAAAGIWFGMNLVEIAEALSNFSSPCGRMKLVSGIKNSMIIDDTYNSSPTSALAAISVLGEISAKRKIAVMGDMLELGGQTEKGHREVARKFLEIKGDIFLAVGERMKFAGEELEKNKFNNENISYFNDSILAGKKLQELVREGDLILIKGSQGMRMEKAVEEIMADPQKAEELLCRQSRDWKNK